MSKFVNEFKQFATRGNVIDMAVGVIIGGAFGKIITSVVNDLLMPLIGTVLGKVNFTDLYVQLAGEPVADGTSLAAAREAGVAVFAYGNFIQQVVDFLIIAFCIFMMIKGVNRLMHKKEEEPAPATPPEPSAEEKLLTEIRDLLKNK